MKDILGREIKVGDIVAHGQRSGNGGSLAVKLVTNTRIREGYSGKKHEEVHVLGYSTTKWLHDEATNKYSYQDGLFINGRGGWTTPDVIVVITESVPANIKEFLQGKLNEVS